MLMICSGLQWYSGNFWNLHPIFGCPIQGACAAQAAGLEEWHGKEWSSVIDMEVLGYPKNGVFFFKGKSHLEMDDEYDDWG